MDRPSGPELLARLRADADVAALTAALPADPAVHLVGGAVRDLIMGRLVTELDLVADGDIEPLAARLADGAVLHDRFGTASLWRGGRRIDLARSRRERYASAGALPEVEPAPLQADLGRRDFTVNAIALALTGPASGELHAVEHAFDDLGGRRLRILHAGSFRDDPTRLVRLARYAARLAFAPEDRTAQLAHEAIAGGALTTISGERLGAELRLLLSEPDPVAAMEALDDLGISAAIEPGFGLRGLDPPAVSAARELLADRSRVRGLVLGLALEGVRDDRRGPLLARLGWPAEERDLALRVVRGRSGLARELASAERPSEIVAAVGGASPEMVAAAGAAAPASGRHAAELWRDGLRDVALEISGDDLLAAGVAPGPQVGEALRAALAAKLDGEAEGRDAELAAALRALGRDPTI